MESLISFPARHCLLQSLQKADCIRYGLHYQCSCAETPPIEHNGTIMERVVFDKAAWFRDPEDHFCCSLGMPALAWKLFAVVKVSAAFRIQRFDAFLSVIFLAYSGQSQEALSSFHCRSCAAKLRQALLKMCRLF